MVSIKELEKILLNQLPQLPVDLIIMYLQHNYYLEVMKEYSWKYKLIDVFKYLAGSDHDLDDHDFEIGSYEPSNKTTFGLCLGLLCKCLTGNSKIYCNCHRLPKYQETGEGEHFYHSRQLSLFDNEEEQLYQAKLYNYRHWRFRGLTQPNTRHEHVLNYQKRSICPLPTKYFYSSGTG